MNLLLADWVFGYGSLIWNPEIPFERSEPARIHGFHRAFCIASVHYRGTPERPGVVLGLDRGGSCTGIAFKLHAADRSAAIERLYAREMLGAVYRPTLVGATLHDGTQVRALTFVANRHSPDYQRLSEAQVMHRLRQCVGARGPNHEYAINTWRALRDHGIHDARLGRIARALLSRAPGAAGSRSPRA